MIVTSLIIGFVLMAAACVIALLRLWKGPTPLDRILSFELMATLTIGLIALFSIYWRERSFAEVLLLFSIFGFLSTATLVFYLEKVLPERKS
jgi:multisubunit Na+/H+ antiporter MnhF subunit